MAKESNTTINNLPKTSAEAVPVPPKGSEIMEGKIRVMGVKKRMINPSIGTNTRNAGGKESSIRPAISDAKLDSPLSCLGILLISISLKNLLIDNVYWSG